MTFSISPGALCFLLVVSSILFPSVAQKVKVDPAFDCTNPNFQVSYTACKAGDYSNCCAVGTVCCAGGCCDYSSVCVGVGTSQETCCDFLDTTYCGTGQAPRPSVICTGGNGLSSYNCPPGATCNYHDDSCIGGDTNNKPSPSLSESKPTIAKSSSVKPVTTPSQGDGSDGSDGPNTVTVTAPGGGEQGTATTPTVSVSVSVSVLTVPGSAATTGSGSGGGGSNTNSGSGKGSDANGMSDRVPGSLVLGSGLLAGSLVMIAFL